MAKILGAGCENNVTTSTSCDKKFRGLDAMYQLRSEAGMHAIAADKDELNDWLDISCESAGKAF